MCLGIPGRIVEIEAGSDLARVDVAGVLRDINVALLDGPFQPGDYLLIHSGFALERMTAAEAEDALQVFSDIGRTDTGRSDTGRSDIGRTDTDTPADGTAR